MSDSNDNRRQPAEESLSDELLEFCNSDSLSEEGVCEIIECHQTPHDVNNYQFFRGACSNKRVNEGIIRYLLEYFRAAASSIDENGLSPLHIACDNPNITLKIVQLLIDAAPDSVRSVDNYGRLPLHHLCKNEDDRKAMQILKLLIEKQPEAIRHADNDGDLPIHNAAWGGRSPEFCRMLIESYPGSERITDGNGLLPLYLACANNTVATVEYLYKLYPDAINHATIQGWYPIHIAIAGLNQQRQPNRCGRNCAVLARL